MTKRLTAVIRREGNGFVALCPELDIASQGDTVDVARDNLRETLELFFECASPAEVQERLDEEVFITQVEVACGYVSGAVGPETVCDPGATRIHSRPPTWQSHRHAASNGRWGTTMIPVPDHKEVRIGTLRYSEPIGIGRLSPQQRLELVGLLWDSLPDNSSFTPPNWHLRELERRIADAKPGNDLKSE